MNLPNLLTNVNFNLESILCTQYASLLCNEMIDANFKFNENVLS